jgi:hypothetical protein
MLPFDAIVPIPKFAGVKQDVAFASKNPVVPALVSRFRSSPESAARSDANFGIEGH